jgi:hypothetical protein
MRHLHRARLRGAASSASRIQSLAMRSHASLSASLKARAASPRQRSASIRKRSADVSVIGAPVSRATVLADPQGSRDLGTHGRCCSGVSSIIVLLIREMKYEESNQNGDCNSHRRIHDGHRTSQAEYVRLVTFGVSLEL